MKKNNCTLLVNSCDKYEDILDLFFELLHRFWPDMPFDIVLSTESLEYTYEPLKIKNIHPENINCSWTERIASALKQIKTDYVFFMLDDFFLYDYVKTDVILENIKMLSENKNIVNFTYWPIINESEDCEYSGFRKRLLGANYKVAAITALWNKKQFLKYVDGYKENIWEFEPKATIRSNTIYPEDEFYVSKDFPQQVVPYNFAKYGLFSGRWFKENKELEEKLGINIDYKKRGFYNISERGLTKSFISAFKIASYVVPKYNFTKDNPIHYHEIQKPGYFEQEYNIKGAKDIVYWSITDQWGFAIKKLAIEVTYTDKTTSKVNIRKTFGNFKYINKVLIFNRANPCVYIPTEKNKEIEKINIKGFLKVPISKLLTKISFDKVRWPKPEYVQLKVDVDNETLLVNNIMAAVTIKPEMHAIINGKTDSEFIKFKEKNTNKTFNYTFFLDGTTKELEWCPSDFAGYSFSDLKISYKQDDNKKIKLKISAMEGLPKSINDQYIFLEPQNIKIKLPSKKVKELYISGTINCPIDKKTLAYQINKIKSKKH